MTTAREFELARNEMVRDQLQRRGIRDEHVLAALRQVPREMFLPASLHARAYDDAALPVECGQTISQPYMVGKMTELLEPRPDQRVLEIGTGTGYQTAVLAALYEQVYTVERHPQLQAIALDRLHQLGIEHVFGRVGDGTAGWPAYAPYDAILVTAGAPSKPTRLLEQLAPNGRAVAPVGNAHAQTLMRYTRTEAGFVQEPQFQCRFVKLIGDDGWGA